MTTEANQTGSGNLIRLKIIHCLACYDSGEIIDPFAHDSRRPCPCQMTGDRPAGGEEYDLTDSTLDKVIKIDEL